MKNIWDILKICNSPNGQFLKVDIVTRQGPLEIYLSKVIIEATVQNFSEIA